MPFIRFYGFRPRREARAFAEGIIAVNDPTLRVVNVDRLAPGSKAEFVVVLEDANSDDDFREFELDLGD